MRIKQGVDLQVSQKCHKKGKTPTFQANGLFFKEEKLGDYVKNDGERFEKRGFEKICKKL